MDFQPILKFLQRLSKNNNREWFEKNRPEYLRAKNDFDDFLVKMHAEMTRLDESLAGLNPHKLAFRIYRDIRFSKDKKPYKTNMGAGFSPGGKMIQEPGYYIHIEPGNKSFLAAGLYLPDPTNLAKVRQEIDYDAGRLLDVMKAPKFRKKFSTLGDFDKLKTAPKGYAADHPHIELLKHKSFIVEHSFSDAEVVNRNFLKNIIGTARVAKPMNDFLKEAIT
jgi:uncharacterized protein (TIGR02453 family)